MALHTGHLSAMFQSPVSCFIFRQLAHLTAFGLRPCVKADPGAFPVPSRLSREKSFGVCPAGRPGPVLKNKPQPGLLGLES